MFCDCFEKREVERTGLLIGDKALSEVLHWNRIG